MWLSTIIDIRVHAPAGVKNFVIQLRYRLHSFVKISVAKIWCDGSTKLGINEKDSSHKNDRKYVHVYIIAK